MANYWGWDKRFIVDGQTIDDNIQVRFGVIPEITAALEISSRRFSDAHMDEVAVEFHNVFMIPQDKRLLVNRNGTRIVIPDYGLEITEEDLLDPVSEQIGLKLEGVHELGNDFKLGFAFQGSYENSQGSFIKKGAQDFGVQVGLLDNFSSGPWGVLPAGFWFLHGNYMMFDKTKDAQLFLRSQQISMLTGLGVLIGANGQAILQSLITESPYRDIGQLSRPSYEIHVGYKHKMDDLFLEVGLIENIFWPFNTPDWGLSLSLSYTWGDDKKTFQQASAGLR